MSHYGTPPPDDSEQQPDQPDPAEGSGSHSSEPPPYNPYPDQWNAPPSGSQPFVAGAGDQGAYAQQVPPSGGYGQLNPYATGPQAQNPYAGSPSPDKPTFGFGGYAGWFTRVGAYLIDQILAAVAGAPLWVGYAILLSHASTTTAPDGTTTTHYSGSATVPAILIILGVVTALAFYVWNICLRQGRTGASVGKSVLAVRLVNAELQPIGAGTSFLRSILHIVDGIPCYLGYLWPIWDSKKQTFADKIVSSYVIQATTPAPTPY
jgi:uncharacterized RDD family membrane protein YckC